MTTYSNLTHSQHSLVLAMIDALEAEGYIYDENHQSLGEYLATALQGISSSSASNLRMSDDELIAGLDNALGLGPVSHLTSSISEMMAAIGNSSGGSPPPSSTPTFYIYGF